MLKMTIILLVCILDVFAKWNLQQIWASNPVPYSERFLDIKEDSPVRYFDSSEVITDGKRKYTLYWRLTYFKSVEKRSAHSRSLPMVTGLHCWESSDRSITDLLNSEPSKMIYEGAFEDVLFLSVVLENANNFGTWWWGNRVDGKPSSWAEDAIVKLVKLRSQDACQLLAKHNIIQNRELVVDKNRLYLVGHSMGGTGVYHIGIKYPELFAAIHAHAGFADFRGPCGDFCSMFHTSMFGSPQEKLTVVGRDNKAYNVFDYTDMTWFVDIHQGFSAIQSPDAVYEPPYIVITHGKRDRAVPIDAAIRLQKVLEKNRYGYTCHFHGGEHSDDNFIKWNILCNFRLNQSYLALSNNSSNITTSGESINYFDRIGWYPSSIIDTKAKYSVVLFGNGFVNVVPRRCQQFRPAKGDSVYYWFDNNEKNKVQIRNFGSTSGIPVRVSGETRLTIITEKKL